MFLSKEALLKAEQAEVFEVTTLADGAFQGAKLKARPLKAAEEAALVEAAKQHTNPVFQAALWLLFALVDTEDPSKRMFRAEDLEQLLSAIDSRELGNLSDQIVSKLTQRAEVTDKAKNSEIRSAEST